MLRGKALLARSTDRFEQQFNNITEASRRFQLSRSECRSKRQANYLETIHIEYSKIDTIINNLPRIIAKTLQSGEP